MKIVFMGTPEFAVDSLKALIKEHNVLAVLTQPDRPAGRGHKLTPSPVKVIANEHGIPVHTPTTLRLKDSKEIRSQLKNYGADIFVVAAYGLLLPKGILEMPPLGCINVHASLLPKYRGASPIHAALLNGDKESGITIMHMDVGIDTGDMIIKKSLEIMDNERFKSLHDRMAILGGEALSDALNHLEKGNAPREKQDDSLSCYAPMINKNDGHINWSETTTTIINKIRAYDLWPGSFTFYHDIKLKILGIEPFETKTQSASPGTIIFADNINGLVVKSGDGYAKITEIQPIGGKKMPTQDFLRGRKLNIYEVMT